MKQLERSFWEITKRFFEPAKYLPWLYIKAFIFYGSWAVKGIIHVLFLKEIIGALELGNELLFFQIVGWYIAYILLQEFLDYAMKFWGWLGFSEILQKKIDEIYVPQFIELDNSELEKLGTGKVVSIIKTGSRMWITLTNDIFNQGSQVIVTVLFTTVMIGSIEIEYAFWFFAIYILVHILGYYLNIKLLQYRNERRDAGHDHTRQMVKIIMSKFEVLQSNRVQEEKRVLEKYSLIAHMANHRMTPYIHYFFRIPGLFLSFFRLGALVYLGQLLFQGQIDFATIVGVSGAFILMDKSIDSSLELFKNVPRDVGDLEKFWDIFDTIPKIRGYHRGKIFQYSKGNIEIQDIAYGYTKKLNVFCGFSLHISGGKVTALVGQSGGGKSTLAKLISGYIRADKGDILIDGQALKKTSLKSYYQHIGYLTQEPSVFDGTVLENLTYAIDTPPSPQPSPLRGEGAISSPSPTKEKGVGDEGLHQILKLAKCEFIYDLPNGLETEIGERGVRLSGGQRQRLAIAKIMLKDPKIIILDEPTSALDSFSEEQITKAMQNLFKGRTVIVIAHRLQTVKHADDIILLENGQVKERGTHKELVKLKGQYAKMLELQSGF